MADLAAPAPRIIEKTDMPNLNDYTPANDQEKVTEKVRFALNTVYFALNEVQYMANATVGAVKAIAGAIVDVAKIVKATEAGIQYAGEVDQAVLEGIGAE